MTDGLNMQTCPKCGKENLAYMTHCVHCGSALDEMFSFEGQIDLPDDALEESATTLPFVLEEMQSGAGLLPDDEPELEPAKAKEDSDTEDVPDWLQRVRQRAREEEDATGELTKGIQSMQDMVVGEEKDDSESQYQDWIETVREKTQREKAKRAERLRPSPLDEQGVPEWLRRIRALNPQDEEMLEEESVVDEWTDEALEDLRRTRLGDDYTPALLSDDTETEEESEDSPEETEEPKIEHNIPEDDEDLLSLESDASDGAETGDSQDISSGAGDAEKDLGDTLSEHTGFVIVGEPKLKPDEVFDTKPPEMESAQTEPEASAKKRLREEEKEAILQDLVILRGQHEKVALLKSMIASEGQPIPNATESKPKKKDLSRLIVGLVFIFVLLLAIIVIPRHKTDSVPAGFVAAKNRFDLHLDALSETTQVLIVLDYSAASATELEPLASSAIRAIEAQGASWQAVATRMDSLWLSASLYQKAGVEDPQAPVYLMGGQFAMLNLALEANSEPQAASHSTLSDEKPRLDDFDYVLLVSDSSPTIRGWLEQVSPNQPELITLAIVSQKEAVAIQPYFNSAQIAGFLTGAQGLSGENTVGGVNINVFRVGLMLMILLFVLGIVLSRETEGIPPVTQEVDE
ncbi:MAG TPA: zinc ribbon domain-containing protein [Anaerolineaceae bacterium]|nr:zinc ribbon domain-containing protein [Anaerolineaceae bacterium]